MPELPEVETMRRGLLPIVSRQIIAAERPPCDRQPIVFTPPIDTFRRRVVGQRVVSVGRRGKRVLIGLQADPTGEQSPEDGQAIVIEPRMTGLVLLSEPPTQEHLRLRLTLGGDSTLELLFWDRRGLGTVKLLGQQELHCQLESKLGVDALEVDETALRCLFGSSRRAIKVALLDQSCVAGIGNLYAAEILFLAGIDPRTRCDRLTRPQWRRVAEAIPRVLLEAIDNEGSTLRDGTYRNALNNPGSYQSSHRVYDRAGERCPRCGDQGIIRRIVQAQRSTFFCPLCQRRSGRHPAVSMEVRSSSPCR